MPDSLESSLDDASFLARTLVIIPALNEAGSVASTVEHWRKWTVARIHVVDNGSTDETARHAADAGATVFHELKRGYGAACSAGLQNLPPQIEWILFSSADGSDRLSAEVIQDWQRHIDIGADLVLGDRFSSPDSRRHLKWVQRIGNRLCCGLIYLGWGRRFNDLASLRLIRRAAFERLRLQDRGFGWNVEMQVRAVELGLRIAERPAPYYPRRGGQSKISGSVRGTGKAAGGMMTTIVHLWWTKLRAPPP